MPNEYWQIRNLQIEYEELEKKGDKNSNNILE